MSQTHKWILLALLFLGLGIRLGWSLSRPSDPASLEALPDQLEYLQVGKSYLAGDRMCFYDPRFNQTIFAARTPGYPLLIWVCSANLSVLRIVQSFLDVSTAGAVFLLARRWLSPGRCLFACALAVLNPLLIYFVPLVLSETLYLAMLAWSVYLITLRRWIYVGLIVGGLAALVRPAGIAIPIVLAFFAAWVHFGSGHRLTWGIGYALAGIVFTIAALTPWAIRNEQLFGHTLWLTSQGGITLYDGVHPGATGASDQSFLDKHPDAASMKELDRDDYFRMLARREILQNPKRVARLALVKVARTWTPVPLSEQFSGNRLYFVAGLAYTVPLFLLAATGLLLGRLRFPVRLYLLAPALVITLMHAITVGSMRYRLPAEPFLAVLAASFPFPGNKHAPK
ncbi:MAG TPA: hypothetical protein VHP11_07085 [Tepidisphaeraceae bacterium]|nr:hypothetical protein [Tepidisphaeraceae bacterium]